MAEIVNLNRFRKAKQRSEAQQRATENRVRFGRSKAEKASDRDDSRRREQALDAARRQEPEAAADPNPARDDAGRKDD